MWIVTSNLDPVRQAALVGMMRPGSVGFQREVMHNIIGVSCEENGSELRVYTQYALMAFFGIFVLLGGLAMSVLLLLFPGQSSIPPVAMWAIVVVVIGVGIALMGFSRRSSVFTRQGGQIHMELAGHRAEVLPAPVSHVDAHGILNLSPITPSEKASKGDRFAAAIVGAFLFGVIGAVIAAGLAHESSGQEKLTGPPGAPEVHVYLEGSGRIRFHHAARPKRILVHAYAMARFFGVEIRNRT